MPNRRDVLGGLIGTTLPLATAIRPFPAEAAIAKAPTSLRILILGGTGFIGPHHVRYAVARGHRVTVFNRGKEQVDLPKEVEHLIGDRNSDLTALAGRDWDAVLDLGTTVPRWVRSVGEILGARTKHYTFVSSLSAYADLPDGTDESAPLREYKGTVDPFTLTTMSAELYGPLKALSEREAERQFPNRVLIVRPGLIVGPGDETNRFSYWPIRMSYGGEVLVPGQPTAPQQYIDARDLAEWVIRMVEARETGGYNVNGPEMPLTAAELLGAIRGTYATPMTLTWVPFDWLSQHQAREWMDLPLWPNMTRPGIMTTNIDKAVAKGLTFRPTSDISRDIMTSQSASRTAAQQKTKLEEKMKREHELLASWHSSR